MAGQLPNLSRTGETWYLSNTSVTGGVTLASTQQVAANPASLWKAKLPFKLKKSEDYLEARGFVAGLDGMFGSFAAGPADWRGQPWQREAITGTEITPGIAKRSANQNPASATDDDNSGTLDFVLAQDAAANSVNITILRRRGGILRRGQYLQIADRMYIIVGLTTGETLLSSGLAARNATVGISIRPWLRAPYSAGTPVNFTNPTTPMRLVNPEQAAVELMSASPQSDFSLDLIEAI